ncbi:DUF6959 family protein [Crateriforma spongiae]|uniref:DUF6959 family protein n=1 Tax=Crateriforma spongiae TaxID=2724528 RepID=UPI001444C540|nr:hypothetical protein [Crateriforma spongiae]
MDTEPLEVFSRDSNYAVIKPPGRQYPGAVIQGDSLGILCRNALRIVARIDDGDTSSDDFLGDVEDLTNSLIDRILHYQSVLQEHDIDFPHVRVFTDDDRVQLVENNEA